MFALFLTLDILEKDTEIIDKSELYSMLNACVKRIHIYCDKVENQTDKLAEVIGYSDVEFTQQLVVENEELCDKAMDCALSLKQR